MIDWDGITDQEMRDDVVQSLTSKRDRYTLQAKQQDEMSALAFKSRREAEACAHYSRRQAAHYKQAIDLLTAAPMPPKDEPR